MKFVLLLAILLMWLANPITGGKLFPGFNNPEKWMKRVIRKLQRKTSAYGNMIASNTANISNTAGFISSIAKCESPNINDPDNGLSCCFEDNLNKGQCLCNGMTIDDTSNPGSCCMANQEHPDHCLCSGTDMDDPTNPGNCCFANSGQRLCTGNYTDVPSKRCFNLDWKGDGICDDQNNHGGCNFDGGDCCGDNVDTDLCTQCQCLEEEAPLPEAVGCCYREENNPQECLCTGTEIDDPDTPGSCCMDDVDNPGNCYRTCPGNCTNSSQGICDTSTGICNCKPGFGQVWFGFGFGKNCADVCTANQITNADICQDCSAGEVPDVMSNLTACVACNPEEITNNGSCQACPEGQVPNANQTVCEDFAVWTGPISTAPIQGDTGNYDSSLFKTLTEDKALVFTVRASNDANLGFFSESQEKLYEIVIGGWDNSKSVIRSEFEDTVNEVENATPNILNPNEDRPFWADAKNGLIRFGRGNIIGNDIILNWQDNQPLDPSYVGFMTRWGSSGIWNYID